MYSMSAPESNASRLSGVGVSMCCTPHFGQNNNIGIGSAAGGVDGLAS
jgi:hypothetical protein